MQTRSTSSPTTRATATTPVRHAVVPVINLFSAQQRRLFAFADRRPDAKSSLSGTIAGIVIGVLVAVGVVALVVHRRRSPPKLSKVVKHHGGAIPARGFQRLEGEKSRKRVDDFRVENPMGKVSFSPMASNTTTASELPMNRIDRVSRLQVPALSGAFLHHCRASWTNLPHFFRVLFLPQMPEVASHPFSVNPVAQPPQRR